MNLFFRKIGDGKLNLIIIHGLYGSSDNWLTIAKLLKNDFSIYLVDQRNHGQSPHSSDMNYELMASDIEEFMFQQDIKSAIIMGHSMGGKTAITFALKNPDKVERLIIVDIAPKSYLSTKDNIPVTFDHRKIINGILSVDLTKFKTRNSVADALKTSIPEERVLSFLLKNIGRKNNKELFWKLNIKAISEHLNDIMDGVEIFNKYPRFPESKSSIFIKGADSNHILNNDYQTIHKYFPSAQIKVIQNAGHWLHAEQTEAFVEMVKYFCLNV